MNTEDLVKEQQPPVKNDNPHSWDLVIVDVIEDDAPTYISVDTIGNVIKIMRARDQEGVAKYGMHLQPGSGRDQLIDSLQEALDLAVYLRSYMYGYDTSDWNYHQTRDMYYGTLITIYKLVSMIEQAAKE